MMMTLTADSGSTKTTWLLSDGNISWTLTTQGINPFHQQYDVMSRIINHELLTHSDFPDKAHIDEIYFYGAGCTKDKSPILKSILQEIFPHAHIEVDSDMLGAARALFGDKPGIACILGTGANSCLYDGRDIVSNVSPMGYILGDEGSGAMMGRTFVNLLYKGGHHDDIRDFEHETGLTQADIIQKVYREPMPNRFLASLAPYIKSISDKPWVKEMITDCFGLFFRHNVRHYNRPDLCCSFVGSIAYYFEDDLRKAAKKEGSLIGKIMKEPLNS